VKWGRSRHLTGDVRAVRRTRAAHDPAGVEHERGVGVPAVGLLQHGAVSVGHRLFEVGFAGERLPVDRPGGEVVALWGGRGLPG
jgi:hypothetical protein